MPYREALVFGAGRGWRSVLLLFGKVVRFLSKRAPKRDIEFLKATARHQHRDAGRESCAYQRERSRVSFSVEWSEVFRGRLAVETWMHIAQPAGNHQAIELREQCLVGYLTPERRNHERNCPDDSCDGVNRDGFGGISDLLLNLLNVARNANERKHCEPTE